MMSFQSISPKLGTTQVTLMEVHKRRVQDYLLNNLNPARGMTLLVRAERCTGTDLFEGSSSTSVGHAEPSGDTLALCDDHDHLLSESFAKVVSQLGNVAQNCGIAAEKTPVAVNVVTTQTFRRVLAQQDKEAIANSSNRLSRLVRRFSSWVKCWYRSWHTGIVFLDKPFGVFVVAENVKKWAETKKVYELGQATLRALVYRAYSSEFYTTLNGIHCDEHASSDDKVLALCMRQWEEIFMRYNVKRLLDEIKVKGPVTVPEFSTQEHVKDISLHGNAQVWPKIKNITAEQMRLLFVCPELTLAIYVKNGVVHLPSSISNEVASEDIDKICRDLNPSEKSPKYAFYGE